MAWRFKASKYKNATPIVPKPESCIRDIFVGSYQTYGNNIAASAAFMAFNVDHNGSSLAVLPLEDYGRKNKTMPLLHAHADTVTDMDFSPFHDGLLATGSLDCMVKLWHIPEEGLKESMHNEECSFSHRQRRVEVVRWHPTAEYLLTTVSYTNLTLWDVVSQKEIFANNDHTDVIQSVSWKQNGTLLSTSCKDKQARIIDPRASENIVAICQSHQSIRDSRIVWLGNSDRILTTGFDAARIRQVYIRDLRNFAEPLKTIEFDCSTGILMPLFDPDTNMLFLAGKGDMTINYMELIEKDPYVVEGIRHSGEQTKGICLVPKRALNVMQAEVNRLLQLTSNIVIPITYQVPRKTYRDFHSDLYPDTTGYIAKNSASTWIKGHNEPVPKISLDPAKRSKGEEKITIHKGNLASIKNSQRVNNMEQTAYQKTISMNTPLGFSKSIISNTIEKNYSNKNDTNKDETEDDKLNTFNGDEKMKNNSGIVTSPPKPLPRSSRTNSLSDEEPKPVARPRTSPSPVVSTVNLNYSGYKPRLGPKPFQAKSPSHEFFFDKVFSVPVAPNNESNGHNSESTNDNKSSNENIQSPTNNENRTEKSNETDMSDSLSPMKKDMNSHESGPKQKISSTETGFNHKLIEAEIQEKLANNDDEQNFERFNSNSNSIAERRKLYESRSLSIADGNLEEKTTPAFNSAQRQKDNHLKKSEYDEEIKKVIPINKQQSMDSKIEHSELRSTPTPKRTSTVFGKVSKFRHLKGTAGHKSTHIENVRNISRQISGECDGFHANADRVAVPLSGPGGKIAVLELKKTGRLADGVIPALVHGAAIMDFQWDPFDNRRLAVACDDGMIRIWNISENGLSEPTNTPAFTIEAHTDKIYLLRFHPLARNVFASASYDMTIKIWDLESLETKGIAESKITLLGHTDQIFSIAWSPCGQYLATVCRDTKLRIYKVRSSNTPIQEGQGPIGTRGARVVWALDGRFVVVIGFDKVSERQILIYKTENVNSPMNVVGLDVSPAILMPHYDEDSSTLFLTGRGDSTIYAFEITEESPYCCPLSHHKCSTSHQGLSFLPKNNCDVANVEFASALRLTNNTIEPLSFTVPRIKSELFQDDLFPFTKVTWKPTMNSSEWFRGENKQCPRISLKPPGMDNLTENQNRTVSTTPASKQQSPNYTSSLFNKWDLKIKQEEMQKNMSNLIGEPVLALEQDLMDGEDDHDWDK